MTAGADSGSTPPEARPGPRGGFARNVLPALLWIIAIFVGGGGQPVQLPGEIGLPVPVDKSEHLLAFLVLSVLGFRALRYELSGMKRWQLALLAAASATAIGVLLEIYQLALPDRSAEVADAVADAIGASFGALVVLLVRAV